MSKKETHFTKEILSKEVAEIELEKWFDTKRVRPDQRNRQNSFTGIDSSREALINSFVYGILVLNEETGELTQNLQFPLQSENVNIDKLTIKPRITRADTNNASVGVKPTDIEGKTTAYLSAITGVPRGQLNKLDETDRSLSDIIVGYFLQ